jgi:hypothetical protein
LSESTDEDKDAILGTALQLAETQISAQVADDASLDGRTTGLVGLNGALLAADLAAKELLGVLWWTPLLVLAFSTALLLVTLFGADRKGYDLSVRAAVFYESEATKNAIPARELLLAELDNAFGFNVERLTRKRRRLQGALAALLAGLACAGLLIALDQPTTMKTCRPKSLHRDQPKKRCSFPSQNSLTPGPREASKLAPSPSRAAG